MKFIPGDIITLGMNKTRYAVVDFVTNHEKYVDHYVLIDIIEQKQQKVQAQLADKYAQLESRNDLGEALYAKNY